MVVLDCLRHDAGAAPEAHHGILSEPDDLESLQHSVAEEVRSGVGGVTNLTADDGCLLRVRGDGCEQKNGDEVLEFHTKHRGTDIHPHAKLLITQHKSFTLQAY